MDSETAIQSGTIELVKTKQLKDIFHEHQPLVFNEDVQWDRSKETTVCSACDGPMSGERYCCAADHCEYHLHKKCGEAPSTIHINHFLCCQCQQHPSLALNFEVLADCKLCRIVSTAMMYKCSDCKSCYHIECVQFSLEYSKIFKHDAHPRPLLFYQNHTDLLRYIFCTGCNEPLVSSIYVSDDLTAFLHDKCAELPSEISLPCHRNHKGPLVLDFHEKTMLCKLCHRQHSGSFYSCSLCNVDIHMSCASPFPTVIFDNNRHPHPFHLFWRQDPFICDACGTPGGCASYVCLICHIQVHPKCASLPPISKIRRHPHPVFHSYFIEEEEFEKPVCRICFREVKKKYGSYTCSKPDCNYIVHVECATENSRLYRVIDQDGQSQEDLETIVSSITCILEKNESGDAIKV